MMHITLAGWGLWKGYCDLVVIISIVIVLSIMSNEYSVAEKK